MSATWRIFLLGHSTALRDSFNNRTTLSCAAVLLAREAELIPKPSKSPTRRHSNCPSCLGRVRDPAMPSHWCVGGLPSADRQPRRLQEECQPCDDAGDDENRFVRPSTTPSGLCCPGLDGVADMVGLSQVMLKRQTTGTTKSRSGTRPPPLPPNNAREDRNTEILDRRFRTMEAASLRLQKEAKGYLDSLRGTECGNPQTRPDATLC